MVTMAIIWLTLFPTFMSAPCSTSCRSHSKHFYWIRVLLWWRNTVCGVRTCVCKQTIVSKQRARPQGSETCSECPALFIYLGVPTNVQPFNPDCRSFAAAISVFIQMEKLRTDLVTPHMLEYQSNIRWRLAPWVSSTLPGPLWLLPQQLFSLLIHYASI